MARRKTPAGKPDYRICYFFLVLAAITFGLGAWAAVQGMLTLRWPKAPAEIVDAQLTRHERERRELRQPDSWHTFAVHYLYTVKDRRLLGGGIEPYDYGMQNSAGAQKMAERYRIGSKTEVAYDPNDPTVAYLMPGPSSFSLILMGIGVAFVLLGGLARRMIRIGPGGGNDKEPPAAPATKKIELDPDIASFYPTPTDQRKSP